jgi:hypothetical protein
MSEFGSERAEPQVTGTTNLYSALGIASGLVAVNILLMLVLSYTPVAGIGQLVFSNFFVGIAVFLVTVGGGRWLSGKALENGNVPLAGGGVLLIQSGYGLFGAALLGAVGSSLRAPALGITAVITALITAVVTAVVYNVDHSFERWNLYSGGLFVGGFVIGAVGFFVAPLLMAVAGLCFFLGFIAYLVHEIWAVKVSAYPGTLINAIGIYVAVMGVFIHVLQWVLRVLSVLDQ